MVKYANKYGVEVDVTIEDTVIIDKRINDIAFQIQEIENSLCWAFFYR
jgi:hypothetical protein